MSTTQENRGRGNNNFRRRGNSVGRGRGFRKPKPEISYNQPAKQEAQQIQSQTTQQILQDNQQRSELAPKPNKAKIDETIAAGKEFVSKFFKGFTQKERGNIRVEVDNDLPERITEVYQTRINQITYDKFKHVDQATNEEDFEKQQEDDLSRFTSGVSLAMAIKLYKSSTQLEKEKNYDLPVLHSGKCFIPDRIGILLNQLGKTDLDKGNRIRINGQDLAAKRLLVKSIYYHYDNEELDKFLVNKDHASSQLLGKIINDEEMFNNMIDDTIRSIDILKKKAFSEYEKLSNQNLGLKIKIGEHKYDFNYRLPKLVDDKKYTIAELVKLVNDPIFLSLEGKEGDNSKWLKILGIITCLAADRKWLRQAEKPIKELNNSFANTAVADITFNDVLIMMRVWNISSFIDKETLSELGSIVAHDWQTHSLKFSNSIKFREFNFSEFGSDAQLVEIDKSSLKERSLFNDFKARIIRDRSKAESRLQMSESGAVLGLATRFVTAVSMKNDFEINFSSRNHDILREFCKADFK